MVNTAEKKENYESDFDEYLKGYDKEAENNINKSLIKELQQ